MDCMQGWGPQAHWFWIIPVGFIALMFVLYANVLRHTTDWRAGPWHGQGWGPWGSHGGAHWAGRHGGETARQILDRRYANSELTKEQYDQMKRDIEADRSAS
jgi:Spy/CpxP family protein refolding chaperone